MYCIRGLCVVWTNSVRGDQTVDAKTSTWSCKQTLGDTETKVTSKAVRLIATGNQRADSQSGTDQNKPRPITNSQVFLFFFFFFSMAVGCLYSRPDTLNRKHNKHKAQAKCFYSGKSSTILIIIIIITVGFFFQFFDINSHNFIIIFMYLLKSFLHMTQISL